MNWSKWSAPIVLVLLLLLIPLAQVEGEDCVGLAEACLAQFSSR